MTYQVLARKWRPQDFDAVVGQEQIVTALRNALTDGRIAQAYVFSGIRGVGKTTVARVLAKALNCERGPASDPCNECTTCVDITRGSDLDVLEIDAATYSKVEQVRELAESLKYGPARDRYKVVILDEIHRLSRQAFDALLKIVEEPPEHLVFVFATTELEAVPATILSRCQEFRFRRVPAARLAEHLRKLAEAEEIEVSDAALDRIARAGEGSVRDSVALLDQMATYGSGAIADEDAARILGGVDAELHLRLLEAITSGDSAAVTVIVGEIELDGWDPRHVYGEFLDYCRDALHLSLSGADARVALSGDEREALAQVASSAGYANLLRLLHLLLESEQTVRRSEAGLLAAEIAWLRAAEMPRLVALEDILAGAPPGDAGATGGGSRGNRGPGRSSNPGRESTSRSAAPKTSGPPSDTAPVPEPERPQQEPTKARGEATVSALLQEISRRRQPLAAHLEDARALDFSDGELTIYTRPDDRWLKGALARDANRELLTRAVETVWGEGATWSFSEHDVPEHLVPSPAADTTTAEARKPVDPTLPSTSAEDLEDSAADHPTVQAALEIFGGTIQTIDPDDAES